MKLKILVISKYKWKSRKVSHEVIRQLLKTGGIEATITTEYVDVGVPLVTNGRIDPEWYEKNITPYAILGGYNHVIFQFSERDGKKWGLDSGIRGHNIQDTDTVGESWVRCDEYSVVKFKDGTFRGKYTKVVPHEIAHELKNRGVTELEIHKYDFKDEINNIEGFYKELGTRATLIEKIKKLTALIFSMKTKTEPARDLLPLVKRKVELVLKDMETFGMPMRMTEGYRSIERQNELYAQGRTKPGNIVTKAKGGESLHNYGVAADFVFRKEGYEAPAGHWKTFAAAAKNHGFEWGGDWVSFPDKPHLQMTLGYTLSDFQNNKVDYSKYN